MSNKTKTQEVDVEIDPNIPEPYQDTKTDTYHEGPHLTEATPAQRGALPEDAESAGIKAAAMQHMATAFKSLAAAENSLSKGSVADAILSIIPVIGLPEEVRPTYAKVAEAILSALGRDVRSAQLVRLPGGELETRLGNVNGYRQFATRYIDIARWESGQWSKSECKHRDERCNGKMALPVMIGGTAYTSPVEAIRSGQFFTTVHRLFKNALTPSFIDLEDIDAAKTETLGKSAVKQFKAPIRGHDNDGKLRKTRVAVAGNAAMTHGAILALLAGLKSSMTKKRWDEIQAELLKVQPAATA